ncbi:Cof-type HAD-IIB family hydrolase [Brevibacillus brevis]|uniref:Cof-type HAD-IIB family hydrolase n=1 Tax=Brevibacillus brevis TaxID=1393 RepID=A0A2Z4MB69_BREBE|nr:Cof-type HAD-IIB family hydrolase [Brevibacillus brevis]AWX53722.1 Cof-type HAD-IIB family hydrolase [Brevibacillus brevis]
MLLTPGMAAFDMDGTLLTQDSKLTEGTKEALRQLQQQGCKLVLSTGRMYGSAQMPIDSFPFDGYVCSNGGAVFEGDGTLVRRWLLPTEMVIGAIHALRQETIYYELHDTNSNRWMIKEDRERLEATMSEDASVEGFSILNFPYYRLARVEPLAEMLEKVESGEVEIVKFFIWHNEPDRLEWVKEQLKAWSEQVTITSSGKQNVEVIPQGVSKWEGLQYFCEKWGISPEKVMAFGDAENDREALTGAGYSVAMENASDEIKQVAKYIAPHHNEEGVARFIRERVLGEKGE